MWKRPANIPAADWAALTAAWDARRGAVYARFHTHAPVPETRIDGIMAGLLGIYYRVERNAANGAPFERQLKDEFHKGHWVDAHIARLRRDYPALAAPARVRYGNDVRDATLADKCVGGIVRAFIDITAAVCATRFGQPYEDRPQALRNGVLERGAWEQARAYYDEKRRTYEQARKTDPHAPPPAIYRQ